MLSFTFLFWKPYWLLYDLSSTFGHHITVVDVMLQASFDGCHLRHRPATDVHRHGVTVRARTRSARSDPDERSLTPGLHSVTPDRALHLPKTYLTRQGALLLFTPSEVAADLTQKDRKCLQKMIVQQSREDCARGFGNLLRLAQSVLMYGGEVSGQHADNTRTIPG